MGYELCSYLAQSKVKSCENSLNIGLNPFRNGFGTPEREERVKYFSTSNVHVECSLGCIQEKERQGRTHDVQVPETARITFDVTP